MSRSKMSTCAQLPAPLGMMSSANDEFGSAAYTYATSVNHVPDPSVTVCPVEPNVSEYPTPGCHDGTPPTTVRTVPVAPIGNLASVCAPDAYRMSPVAVRTVVGLPVICASV